MKKKQATTKRHKLFESGTISTRLAQAISCDLDTLLQKHRVVGSYTPSFVETQKRVLLKKFSDPRIDEEPLVEKTLEKFLSVNDHMRKFNPDYGYLDERRGCIQKTESRLEAILRRAKSFCAYILRDFTTEEWFRECSHSSGSSIGVSYKDTSLEAKLTFPISVTKDALPLIREYMRYDRQIYRSTVYYNRESPEKAMYNLVEGSRAATVEKDNTIRRMIAVEPTANMFLQQGLMRLMYNRLAEVGLDIQSQQQRHTRLAWESSITGRNATIDFSSASDCVSASLTRYLLPPKWFSCLDRLRSKTIAVNNCEVPLHMFSTMGNAGTFPLETLIFYALALGSVYHDRGLRSVLLNEELCAEVSVYGDDCIVPTESANTFIEVCKDVGFLVNEEKSFLDPEPGFRESCGGDYYRGVNVRPMFIRSPTSERFSALEPWLYTIGNAVFKKYTMCFGQLSWVYEKRFWSEWASLMRENGLKLKVVPPDLSLIHI